MNQLKKLNIMHELIMQLIAGEAVFKVADELYESWSKWDHIQHTSDSILGNIEIFNRQVDKVFKDIDQEYQGLIKSSLDLYLADREKLKHGIQHDRVDKRLFEPIKLYIEVLNTIIDMLKSLGTEKLNCS